MKIVLILRLVGFRNLHFTVAADFERRFFVPSDRFERRLPTTSSSSPSLWMLKRSVLFTRSCIERLPLIAVRLPMVGAESWLVSNNKKFNSIKSWTNFKSLQINLPGPSLIMFGCTGICRLLADASFVWTNCTGIWNTGDSPPFWLLASCEAPKLLRNEARVWNGFE